MEVNFLIRLLKRWIKAKLKFELSERNSNGSQPSKSSSKKQNNNLNRQFKVQQTSNIDCKDRVSYDVFENENTIRQIFDKCFDLIIREINITNNKNYPCRIIYFANMIDKQIVEENIMKKLTDSPSECSPDPRNIEYAQGVLGIGDDDTHEDMDKIENAILEGNAIIFIHGINKALTTRVIEPPSRGVSEPVSEKVVRGPREGFVELLPINLTLIRRKIKSANLKMELVKVGRETRTDTVICYMSNIADGKIVQEVRKRVNEIDIDSVLDSNYIAEYIQDDSLSLVPTIFRTEKPDVIAGKILEGRIAILVDGTPIALTVPSVFPEFMMTSEDYYESFILATVLRWLRYLALYMSITLPGVYVSLVTFHSELLPSQLMITVARSREKVPFNAFVEAFLMILTFTILQEADTRIPKTMGQAVSVVGALVLGEAAVSAGIVSPPMVIIAAFSGIASLAIPSPEMQFSLIYLRFIVLMASAIFGLFGVTCVLLAIFMYLVSLRSFGVPYMTPVSPIDSNDLKDVFIRAPLWKMRRIPKFITWKNLIRRQGRINYNNKDKAGESVSIKRDMQKE